MMIYNQLEPPLESGWWWVRDDEVIHEDQWWPVYLTVGNGTPARIATVWPDGSGSGELRTWEFEWDGEDWVQVSEYGYAEVKPTTWVKLTRHSVVPTDDEINNAIHFGVDRADTSVNGGLWMAAEMAIDKLLGRAGP